MQRTKYCTYDSRHHEPSWETSASPRVVSHRKLRKRKAFAYLGENTVSYDLSRLACCKNSPPNDFSREVVDQHPAVCEPISIKAEFQQSHTGIQPPCPSDVLEPPPRSSLRRFKEQLSSKQPPTSACQNDEVVLSPSESAEESPNSVRLAEGVNVSRKRPTSRFRYDRTTSLAESYQAILPDIRTLEYDYAKRELPPSRSSSSVTGAPRNSLDGGPAPSVAATSVTAVESPNSDIPASFLLQDPSFSDIKSEFSAELPPRVPSPPSLRKAKPPQIQRMSDYIGPQLCLDLLTDELVGAFLRRHPLEGERGERVSKLQILLLIEVYEAMLQKTRLRMLEVPLGAQETAYLRDGVRVLGHWLHSLYCIYDEMFLS